MKARLLKIAKYAAYPLFYGFCLLLFFYLTFPMQSLKGRIIAEFERQQRIGRPPGEPAMTLQLGEIDSYWFSGVDVKNVVLTVPAPVPKPKPGFVGFDLPAADAAAAKPSVLSVDRLRARVRLLPLVAGNVRIDFTIDAFGGRITGSAPFAAPGNVQVQIDGIHLEHIGPLKALLQDQPLFGVATGAVELAPEDGKFAKASGKVELVIANAVMFDGKTKLMGVALPAANIGRISLHAKADKGQLTIEELSAHGDALELFGEGKVRLHESYKRSIADLYVKFKFSDAYRDTDDATRSLLGKPGERFRPAIELDPAKTFVRAKTDDGFYRFHLVGPLDRLEPQPAGDASGNKGPARPQFGDFAGEPKRGGGVRGGGDPPAPPAIMAAPGAADAARPALPQLDAPEGRGAPED